MKFYIKPISLISILIALYACTPVIYTTQTPPPPQQVVAVQPQPQAPPPPVVTPPQPQPDYGPQPTYQVFYDELTPYGSWVDYQSYGYVWIPRVGQDFEPYTTAGHWVLTDQGWTWYSDYNWGWAPFHYGRWLFDEYYGWMWIPGHEWAPAWVTWGTCNNYYCWAPLGPGEIHYDSYRPSNHYWHFVPAEHITENNINHYVVNNTTVVNNVTNITIINNTNTVNNVTFNKGPKKEEVEQHTHYQLTPVHIKETNKPPQTNNNPGNNNFNNNKNNNNNFNNNKNNNYNYNNNNKDNNKFNNNNNNINNQHPANQNESLPVYKPKVIKNNENKDNQMKPAPKKVEKIENIQPYHKQNNIEQKNKPELNNKNKNTKDIKEEENKKHQEELPIK